MNLDDLLQRASAILNTVRSNVFDSSETAARRAAVIDLRVLHMQGVLALDTMSRYVDRYHFDAEKSPLAALRVIAAIENLAIERSQGNYIFASITWPTVHAGGANDGVIKYLDALVDMKGEITLTKKRSWARISHIWAADEFDNYLKDIGCIEGQPGVVASALMPIKFLQRREKLIEALRYCGTAYEESIANSTLEIDRAIQRSWWQLVSKAAEFERLQVSTQIYSAAELTDLSRSADIYFHRTQEWKALFSSIGQRVDVSKQLAIFDDLRGRAQVAYAKIPRAVSFGVPPGAYAPPPPNASPHFTSPMGGSLGDIFSNIYGPNRDPLGS